MDSPRLVDTYLKVKDMDRAVSFYETFLGVKATSLPGPMGLDNGWPWALQPDL